MWDSNSPLQLLQAMPKKLTKENLEKLQMVIDADKYKNSLVSGFDLCGMYAPFCRGCKKMSIYPCAIAYVNMLRAEGMDIEIDAKPMSPAAPIVPPAEVPVVKETIEEAAVSFDVSEEKPTVEEEPVVRESVPAAEPVAVIKEETVEKVPKIEEVKPVEKSLRSQQEKRKIRIAVARKKL